MAASVAANQDLLTEILLRLPVKPLIRFKCVSKQWLTLISNPRFCHSHTLRRCHTPPHPFPSSLLLVPEHLHQCPVFSIIPLTSSHADPSPLLVSNFRFLNVPNMELIFRESRNGLLLVQGRSRHQNSYFVCNPITKQFVSLSFPNVTSGKIIDSLFLAFDPLRSSHFKVVSIKGKLSITSDADIEFEIYMYSSETGCWSDLGICFTASTYLRIRNGIYCNGAIHWYNDHAENSLYFDVENQCLKTYPMPSNIQNHGVEYFGESGGHLHMIMVNNLVPTGLVFDISELKEDYSGWSAKFHVDLNSVVAAFPHWDWGLEDEFGSVNVLCIVRQEKEEDSMLVFYIDGRVMSYNLVNYTFRELSSFQPFEESNPLLFYEVFQFFENLSWVGASTTY